MSVMNVVSAQRVTVRGQKYATGNRKKHSAQQKTRPKYQSRKHNPYGETPTKRRGGY